jgi:manganese/zinc/iron transport system ATP- binding protein
MKTGQPAIQVTDLTVAYRDKPVLWDVDLTIPGGVLIGIIGPNGAGKTTLMKAILGLVRPSAGQVLVYGRPYAQQRRLVAYVPQRSSVDWDFPTSVLDVVVMGRYGALGWFRRPGKREREQALEALARVGMQDFASRQIGQLSGGQQQRVFLARALVQDAQVYLMDEPLQGVDATTERTIIDPTAKTHRRDAEDAEISINRSPCLLRRCSDMTFLQQTHYSYSARLARDR